MPKVLVSDDLAPQGLEVLRQAPGIELIEKPGLSVGELLEIIPEIDGLVIRSGTKVTADVIEAEIVPEVRLSYDDDEKTPGFAEAQVKAAAARQTRTEGSAHGPPTPPPSDDSGMP